MIVCQNGVLIEVGGRGQFPLEWLHNTPFSDYTIPALVLAIVVGGSSLIAVVTVFTGREVGVLTDVAAGFIMADWIVSRGSDGIVCVLYRCNQLAPTEIFDLLLYVCASVYQGLQTLALDVAKQFSGRARFAQPALVDGALGAVWAPGGQPRVVFGFTITHGKIVAIDILADPERLRQFDLAILND